MRFVACACVVSVSLAPLFACSPADGVPEFAVGFEPSDRSPLALYAHVFVGEPAQVFVEFVSDGTEPQRTLAAEVVEAEILDVVGLRADSEYSLFAVAVFADGREARTQPVSLTTGSLPAGIPDYGFDAAPSAGAGITLVAPTATLGAPYDGPLAFGLDGEGEVVWLLDLPEVSASTLGGHPMHLLPDGRLVLLAGDGVRVVDPGGRVQAELLHADHPDYHPHHDALVLPSGNFVVLDSEVRDFDLASWGGPVTVKGDRILELDPDGEIVWQWSAFDHIDPERWPGVLSREVRQGAADWTHANGLFHDPVTDQLLLSARHQNWVLAIDRATGAVAYRFGADGDFWLQAGSWFTSQHHPSLSADGRLWLFDNGNEKPGAQSRAVTYRLDPAAGIASEDWSFDVGWLTETHGSVQPLHDGNALVSAGGWREPGLPARVAEVRPDGEVVWDFVLPTRHRLANSMRVSWVEPAP